MIRIIPRQSFPYMIVTMILGTLNHFLYDWSGKNPVIALFTPVNESVWEHMKLLFFPFLLLSLIEYIIRRPDRARFFGSRLFAVWCGMLFIIMLFYGYSGAIGRSFVLIDILLYYLGVIITYSLSETQRGCSMALPYSRSFYGGPEVPFYYSFLLVFHRRYHCLSVLNPILMHLHYRHDYNQIHLLLLHFYTNRLTSDIHNISKAYPSSTDPSRRF